MSSYITVKEAAESLNCSKRKIQMMCKEGTIKGATKAGGIWFIPSDFSENKPDFWSLQSSSLYGKNVRVKVSLNPKAKKEESGCTVTEYKIINGITLVFQDIHEEKLDYSSSMLKFPKDLIAIQHCREGRFEGQYPNGEYIYMGPDMLSVNLPAWAPVTNSFPLKHYHGLYIAILPKIAEEEIKTIEKATGPLNIDFNCLTQKLSPKNRLAVYSLDDKTKELIASIYPQKEKIKEERLRLKVLEFLQMLCTSKSLPCEEEVYFTYQQVNTIKEIRKYLADNLDTHISLTKLSKKFKIPLTGMKACFKAVYGQPPGKYLREYRMQSGAEKLAFSNLKVIEIASSLGYENSSKFSKAFKEYYGISPVEYRKTFCPSGLLSDEKE